MLKFAARCIARDARVPVSGSARVSAKQLAEVGLSIVCQGFPYYLVPGTGMLTSLSVGPTCQQYER